MEDKASVAASAASKVAYAASGSAAAVGWTVNEIVSVAGLALGIATFAVNWYYRHRHLQVVKQQAEEN